MLGAIIGDMVGSIYEFHPIKSKEFDIHNPRMHMTDDSLLTIAVAKVLTRHHPFRVEDIPAIQKDLVDEFVAMWKKHKDAGWGGRFYMWANMANHGIAEPYKSFGNGSAMRISPVAWAARDEEELKVLSRVATEITHNAYQGLKGAEAVAMATFMALHGATKEEIRERMIRDYYPEIADFDFDDLVKNYQFSEICQTSVPQAIYCFLISTSLEDAIRNCVAIGGDCDTTGAMAGAIAEAYYQREEMCDLEKRYFARLDTDTKKVIREFHRTIGSGKRIPEDD